MEQGYRRIKLKIATGQDLKLLDAVRARFPDIHLTVDANCCYTLADLALLRKLDSYGLDYIEQPLAWNDLHDHVRLQSILSTPSLSALWLIAVKRFTQMPDGLSTLRLVV
ncbi:L-alanine-DL-glutamate epimerase-like enolase superfamily enzyme [Rhizobium pisi]